MPLLLDTHVLLWLISGNRRRIPEQIVAQLERLDTRVLLSAVCVLEIAIKRSSGKLDVEDGWVELINQFGFQHRPVTAEHAVAVGHLPWHHRDPFDRLLVAQAKVEGATLVTADERLSAYDVPVLWG